MSRATVIIPHLHQWDHLVRCLQSLARQTAGRDTFDVIVVDNGSKDFDSRHQGIVDRFPGTRFLQELTPGPGPARNLGVSAAGTDMILCIDADCVADENWVAQGIAALQTSGPGTIHGGDVLIGMANPDKPTAMEAYEAIFAFRQKLYIEKKHFSGTGNLAFWKSDFARIGPFAGIGLAEDFDWGQRAHALGLAIRFVPGMIVYHPARDDMAALEKKWVRHVAHQLSERRSHPLFALIWPLHAAAVALSWIPHLAKIWSSPRLRGVSARMAASGVLLRIRLFRAAEMIRQAFREEGGAAQWNR